jgi:hypothetical protein
MFPQPTKCDACGHSLVDGRCEDCQGPAIPSVYDAVRYMLDRIQVDADLAWHMWNTQAFVLLCAAEALATAKTYRDVRKERERDRQPSYDKREARLPLAMTRLDAIQGVVDGSWTEHLTNEAMIERIKLILEAERPSDIERITGPEYTWRP